MTASRRNRPRVHLLSHANPATLDVLRFGFTGVDNYLSFIREHAPDDVRITARKALLSAVEDQQRGGRRDDAARIRDVQSAINDPETRAIVALNGGAYFSRILPHLDFSPLAHRTHPLWAFGFSEMTNFVNLVASYRSGRGVYWLCPNYLAWKIRPPAAARDAFASFWRQLPGLIGGTSDAGPANQPLHIDREISGELRSGRAADGPARLIGGCLSVLSANLAGPLARRLKPDGRWLVVEDVNEQPYRIDRHFATLKLAGWFERVAGVLVGDFHMARADQTDAVLELLNFHLPKARRVPVVVAPAIGHTWPMVPVPINRRLIMSVLRRRVRIET